MPPHSYAAGFCAGCSRLNAALSFARTSRSAALPPRVQLLVVAGGGAGRGQQLGGGALCADPAPTVQWGVVMPAGSLASCCGRGGRAHVLSRRLIRLHVAAGEGMPWSCPCQDPPPPQRPVTHWRAVPPAALCPASCRPVPRLMPHCAPHHAARRLPGAVRWLYSCYFALSTVTTAV